MIRALAAQICLAAAQICLAAGPAHAPYAPEVYRDAERVTWHVPGGHVMGVRLPIKGAASSKAIDADGR